MLKTFNFKWKHTETTWFEYRTVLMKRWKKYQLYYLYKMGKIIRTKICIDSNIIFKYFIAYRIIQK